MNVHGALFIAGAHTEIGKTHVACGILRAAREQGWSVETLKPVVSGFDEDDWAGSDPGRLLAAAGEACDTRSLQAISPWRFKAPLAPPMAAEAERRSLPFAPIVNFCHDRVARASADLVVVEGVGGLMSPFADGATTLDLLVALPPCAVVLVGGSYLGAISHVLTAYEVMRMRGLTPAAVLISEDAAPGGAELMATVALTTQFLVDTPVIPVSRRPGYGWAGIALRAALPDRFA